MKVLLQRQRRQAGDTIVEVLIAISIVSVVLVGAFAVSNHSTLAVQDSAEHSQAQQLLQEQVEELRSYVQSVTASTISRVATSGAFCIANGGPVIATAAECKSANGGATYIKSINLNTSTNTYDCTITWDSITGGNAKAEFFYRIQAAS